jgi:TPR repeat protein
MMGVILAGGKCGMIDEQAAAEHWHTAALQGDVWSKYRLATMTHIAKTETDLTAAGVEALERVTSPRHAAAANLIRGQVSRSLHYLRLASRLQRSRLRQDLYMTASDHAANGDWATAAELWEQAAAIGHVPSHAALAEIYFEGRAGVARWSERAAALATKGSEKGCGDCKVEANIKAR